MQVAPINSGGLWRFPCTPQWKECKIWAWVTVKTQKTKSVLDPPNIHWVPPSEKDVEHLPPTVGQWTGKLEVAVSSSKVSMGTLPGDLTALGSSSGADEVLAPFVVRLSSHYCLHSSLALWPVGLCLGYMVEISQQYPHLPLFPYPSFVFRGGIFVVVVLFFSFFFNIYSCSRQKHPGYLQAVKMGSPSSFLLQRYNLYP